MSVLKYLSENYVMVFELIGLLIILFISVHSSKKIKVLTRIMIGLLLLTGIVWGLENGLRDLDTLNPWRYILTYTKYTLYPVTLILLIAFISEFNKPLKLKWLLILIIPEVISIPFYYSSQWSHLIVYYTADNSYQKGILGYWPYVIFILYFLIFVAINFIYLRNYTTRNKIIYIYLTLGSFAYVIISLIFDLKDDYTPIFASSLIFYFLFIYIHMSSIDPLTSLANRQMFYQTLSERNGRITAVVSIDMNDLKLINDNEGHVEGDTALKTISMILQRDSLLRSIPFRIGGDEFIILYINVNREEAYKNVEHIKEKLKETRYVCAFGYAEVTKTKNVEEALKEADIKMYEHKALLKSGK